MTPERWQQVEDVYHTVMARPARERAGAVAELCSSDEALGNEVESLLAHREASVSGDAGARGDDVASERASSAGGSDPIGPPATGRRWHGRGLSRPR